MGASMRMIIAARINDRRSAGIVERDFGPCRRWRDDLNLSDTGADEKVMIAAVEFVVAWVRCRVEDERGASLVEYALLLALIAVVCIAAITLLGTNASTSFSHDANSLAN